MISTEKRNIEDCLRDSPFILTEGAVGLRLEREYGIRAEAHTAYAGLIYDPKARAAMEEIYGQYLRIAESYNLPILLMTNTRRANRERVARSPYDGPVLMREYAQFLRELSAAFACETYIGGIMGCRGDAYRGDEGLPMDEAISFHQAQAEWLSGAGIDCLFAGIMPCLPEAMGMARVMAETGLPYIISLMIRPDGRMLDGTTIHDAIGAIDGAAEPPPLCYMTNCVHPSILLAALQKPCNDTPLVRARFCGIQANAASLSPEALDHSAGLRTSAPEELADSFARLLDHMPLKILGGCCGTDERHIERLAHDMHYKTK